MENLWGLESGPSKRLPRMLTAGTFQDVTDPEFVPSSLAQITAILRVANEIEDMAPRVAYLCRFYAFDKAHKLDPFSRGRGVRQFKTALLHKLETDDETTLMLRAAKSDAREMRNFYRKFNEKYVKSSESSGGDNIAQLAKTYQIASVLFDVLKAVSGSQELDSDVIEKAKELESKKDIYVAYNVLPLDPGDVTTPAIMLLPEVDEGALDAKSVARPSTQ